MATKRLLGVVVFLAVLSIVAAAVSSCGGEAAPTTQVAPVPTVPVASTAPVATTVAGAGQHATTASLPDATTTSVLGVSTESIAYAESLGGTSHEGEPLFVVIGASVESEAEAQRRLEEATPMFGDMQSYFVVQRSDNFGGLTPGWWVVFEAYYHRPDSNELDFGRRGFPDAYVKQVTVRTSDPIPVYEDAVGLTEIDAMRDVIAQSGDVASGFEISDYLISEDGEWAGVMIRRADLVSVSVLLFRSGLKGWQVMDLGTGLGYQDILDQGAPDEIATFLTCFT